MGVFPSIRGECRCRHRRRAACSATRPVRSIRTGATAYEGRVRGCREASRGVCRDVDFAIRAGREGAVRPPDALIYPSLPLSASRTGCTEVDFAFAWVRRPRLTGGAQVPPVSRGDHVAKPTNPPARARPSCLSAPQRTWTNPSDADGRDLGWRGLWEPGRERMRPLVHR